MEIDSGRGSSPSEGVFRSSRSAAASAGMGNSRTFRSSSMIVAYDGASAVNIPAATSDTHSNANRNPHVPTVGSVVSHRISHKTCHAQSFSGSSSDAPSVTGNLQSMY